MEWGPSYTPDGTVMWYSHLGRCLSGFIKISNACFLWPNSGLEGGICVSQGTVMTHWVLGKYDNFYWCLTLCHPFKFLVASLFCRGYCRAPTGCPLRAQALVPSWQEGWPPKLMSEHLGTYPLPRSSLDRPGQPGSNDWPVWGVGLVPCPNSGQHQKAISAPQLSRQQLSSL